jgi:hypothetical protein
MHTHEYIHVKNVLPCFRYLSEYMNIYMYIDTFLCTYVNMSKYIHMNMSISIHISLFANRDVPLSQRNIDIFMYTYEYICIQNTHEYTSNIQVKTVSKKLQLN